MAERYLIGTGNRDIGNPLNWSSTSGGTPADLLGSELITNAADREFSNDTGFWGKETGLYISGGSANFVNSALSLGIYTSGSFLIQYKVYKVTFSITSYASGGVRIMSGANVIGTTRNQIGTYTEYIRCLGTGATAYVAFRGSGASNNLSIDNISIQEVLSVPNSSNPAIIDANSSIANGDVLSLSAQFDCGGFDCSAAAYTFTLSNAAYAFNVYGDFKDSIKRINGFSSTGFLYIKGNCNIYSNGATQGWNRINFDGVGATFTNQDDMTLINTETYLANGHWNTNNKTITTNQRFYTVAGGTCTLTLGNSLFYILQFINNSSNFTFNYNTSHVILGGFSLVNITNFYDLTITAQTVATSTGAINCHNLTIVCRDNLLSSIYVRANYTISNNLIVNGINSTTSRHLITSDTIGTPRTITVNGSIVASNVDFRDITLAGTANRDLSAITGGSGDCGGNSGITFTPSIDCYIKHTSGTMNVSDPTKWVTTDGGSTQARVPLMQDRAWGTANSFTGAATINMNCPRIGSIDLSGVNQAVTFSLANSVESYGNFVLGNNITIYPNNLPLYLFGRGNFTINTYNKTLHSLSLESPNCLYTNLSNIITTSYFRVNTGCGTTGTFDFNDFNINSDFAYIPAGRIFLGNGILTFTRIGSYIFWAIGQIDAENSTIILKPAPNTENLSFIGGGNTYNKVIFSGQHTGNFVISGNNTFNELIIEKGRKVRITGGSTQTISPTGKLIADGTPTEQIQITSTNTTPFNLVYAGTGFHQVNYCNISYSNATANRFYAGTNSINGGNNTGWIFKNYLTKYTTIVKRKLKLIN